MEKAANGINLLLLVTTGLLSVTSGVASSPQQQALVSGREYVQADCYGLRYYSDVPLFLSVQNDSSALAKLAETGRLKSLIETEEVEVVGQDASGQFKEIREPGDIEFYFVLASEIGPTKPQGLYAEIGGESSAF